MNENREIMIQIKDLKKRYKLGTIGGGTLTADLQSWWARVRHKEDPNTKIGTKTYGKNETFMALDGINLTVYKGERLGVIGHNGAGKSTLLKLLSRVTGPTEGEICLNGRISSMLEVGTGFNPELTGRENIYLNGAILGMTKAEVDQKIDQIIEFSECAKFIDTPVKRYSSGMYVKLAFAVAAHLDSEILVMDEVLAVGDMKFQQKCLGKMSDVSKGEGRTVLYVSHNMSTIRQLCDRCIVLDHGKLIFEGEVEEAIEIYMSNSVHNQAYVDLSEVKRPASMGQKLRIQSFEFSKAETMFQHGEDVGFYLRFNTTQYFKELRLRLEISYYDETKIGIFESKSFYNLEEGQHYQKFSFNPTILPQGKYFITLDFYEINEMGRHASVEHPFHNILFEIIDDVPQGIMWDHKYMGHARLGALLKL